MALGIAEAVDLIGRISDLVKQGATIELRERVMELREAMLNVKDELLELRAANHRLRESLAGKEDWRKTSEKYKLVETVAGGLVYRTDEPPAHFACPKCYGEEAIGILQPSGEYSAMARCSRCGGDFAVKIAKSISINFERPI